MLDVGCGTGVTLGHLVNERGICAVGLDSSAKLVAQGKQAANLPITMGDAAAVPFADAAFHGVLMECVLSVVQDCKQVLKECYRILRAFGKTHCHGPVRTQSGCHRGIEEPAFRLLPERGLRQESIRTRRLCRRFQHHVLRGPF